MTIFIQFVAEAQLSISEIFVWHYTHRMFVQQLTYTFLNKYVFKM